MRTLPFFSAALLFWLALVCPALAQTTIHVPADQPTVQAAINVANPGDTVLVAPGAYTENIDFLGKAITVTSSDGPAKTILDGGNKSATVAFQTNETRASVISGFTIRNGTIESSTSEVAGGVYVGSAAPTILDNVITGNGCYGVNVNSGAALIQGNDISNNGTPGAAGYCSFNGAGILLIGHFYIPSPGSPSASTILGNTIEHNNTGDFAGGIFIWANDGSVIQNNIIRNNGAFMNFSAGIGMVNSNNVAILQNQIYGNSGASGGGIDLEPPSESAGPFIGILEGNTITGNHVSASQAGDDPTATEVYLEGNLAQYVLVNNIIVGNSSSTPAMACGTNYNYLSYTPLVFDHNDIHNPAGRAYGGACPDQTGTYGNISADPLFQNAANFDFHLLTGSPARDTGNNSAPLLPATDFSNTPRIQDSTGLGYPIVDMGVFEAAGQADANVTVLTLVPSTFYPMETIFTPVPISFTLTAQLASAAGIPSGPVTFLQDNKLVGTLMVDPTGAATLTPLIPTPGLHAFLATYPGQGAFPSAVSVKFFVLFPKSTPTLTLTSAPNPSILNSPVTVTVHIATPDGSAPGPITLADGNTNLATLTPDSSGNASFITSTLTLGAHTLTATFAGNNSFDPTSATTTQTVVNGLATTTTLTSSLNPSHLGDPVTFTAHVALQTPAATPVTGTVLFTDGTTTLGTVPLDTAGNATLTTSTLTATNPGTTPTHPITATFQPAAGYLPSTSNFVQQVVLGLASRTNLFVSPASGTTATTFTLTATVVPVVSNSVRPTGTVQFFSQPTLGIPNASSLIGTATLHNGTAILTLAGLPSGTDYITSVYPGDTTFDLSTAPSVPVTISAPPTSLTLTPSAYLAPALAPITITAHILVAGHPAPAGIPLTLTFAGTTIPLTTDSTGAATYTATDLLPGDYTVTLAFAGTLTLQPATPVSLQEAIGPNGTATTLTATPNPAFQHQTVTLTATVILAHNGNGPNGTTAPTGELTFLDGTTPLATLPLTPSTTTLAINPIASIATFTTSSLAPGRHPLTAIYIPSSTAFVATPSLVLNLLINPQDFTLTPTTPSLTVVTGHHIATTLNLASVGDFAGPVTLTCLGPLPQWLTCELPTAPTALAANGTATVPFTLDTDAILGYHSQLGRLRKLGSSPGSAPRPSGHSPLFAGAVPVLLLCLRRRLRPSTHLRTSAATAALCLLVALSLLAGCGDRLPSSTAPGTYTLVVQATGQLSGTVLTTQTTTITLTVTQ